MKFLKYILLVAALFLVVGCRKNKNVEQSTKEEQVEVIFKSEELSDAVINYIEGVSYHSEYGVDLLDELRLLTLTYVDFEGETHNGEMIVNESIAEDTLEVFQLLYEANYPIQSIKLVEEFDGDDELSMRANNTSAFNMRYIEGTTELSRHSYGLAIDLNPLMNPMVIGDDELYPATATDYVDRTKDFEGKIDENDLAYELFTERGFYWGGYFQGREDYQHFEIRSWQ